MNFDIRLPIGAMFSILGALLFGYGFISDSAIYERSLGINVNVVWGAVLLVFGFTMLALAWFGSRAARAVTPERAPPVSGPEKPTHA